jgi:hypothetical protein
VAELGREVSVNALDLADEDGTADLVSAASKNRRSVSSVRQRVVDHRSVARRRRRRLDLNDDQLSPSERRST